MRRMTTQDTTTQRTIDPLRLASGAVFRPAEHAEQRSFLGGRARVRLAAADTSGWLGVHDHLLPAGTATPWHVHPDDDESFLVLSGTVELKIADQRVTAEADDAAFVPRGVPHAFRVTSPEGARLLCMGTPGGHEAFFLAAGDPVDAAPGPPDLERMARAAASSGFAILGPPPFGVA
jgi:mannose-6-phosphate isomerase-like protein (cupin superfamily)